MCLPFSTMQNLSSESAAPLTMQTVSLSIAPGKEASLPICACSAASSTMSSFQSYKSLPRAIARSQQITEHPVFLSVLQCFNLDQCAGWFPRHRLAKENPLLYPPGQYDIQRGHLWILNFFPTPLISFILPGGYLGFSHLLHPTSLRTNFNVSWNWFQLHRTESPCLWPKQGRGTFLSHLKGGGGLWLKQ